MYIDGEQFESNKITFYNKNIAIYLSLINKNIDFQFYNSKLNFLRNYAILLTLSINLS